MSRIWSVVCVECKESIDVGQGWCRESAESGTLWTGTMEIFWLFLWKHRQYAFGIESPQQHNLKFVDEEGDLIDNSLPFGYCEVKQ